MNYGCGGSWISVGSPIVTNTPTPVGIIEEILYCGVRRIWESQYFQLFGELQFALEIGLFKIKMVFTDSNDPNRVGWISPPALQDLAAEMMPSECSPSLAFDTLLASFFPTVTVFLSLHASSWLSSLQERKSLSPLLYIQIPGIPIVQAFILDLLFESTNETRVNSCDWLGWSYFYRVVTEEVRGISSRIRILWNMFWWRGNSPKKKG